MNESKKPYASVGGTELSLWDITKILLAKIHWLLLAGVVVAAGVYAVVTIFVTPTYESRVSFYVYNSADNSSQGTINNSDLQAAESLATTYSKILASNSVLDSVLSDLRAETSLSRKELSRMVNVSVVSDTQLLEVVVTSTDPELSCKIANSFAKVAPTEIVRITKAGGVEVVDRPEVATEKSAPRAVFDSAIGFVVGMILASVAIILRMMADTTIYLPEEDRSYLSRSYMLDQVAGLLGGRVAEEMMLGDISTGASSDIQRATAIARKMVGTYGMSAKMGSVAFDAGADEVFIGKSMGHTRPYSEETAAEMDAEIRAIIDAAYQQCREILARYKSQLTAVAEYLLENETMDAETFETYFADSGENGESRV